MQTNRYKLFRLSAIWQNDLNPKALLKITNKLTNKRPKCFGKGCTEWSRTLKPSLKSASPCGVIRYRLTDWRTNWRTDTRTSVTIVCISCIRCSLKMITIDPAVFEWQQNPNSKIYRQQNYKYTALTSQTQLMLNIYCFFDLLITSYMFQVFNCKEWNAFLHNEQH